MPVFIASPEFDALKAEFDAAQEEETIAVRLASGLAGMRPLTAELRQQMKAASNRMVETHDKKMAVYQRMLAIRADKD
jgi:hypothetical protein